MINYSTRKNIHISDENQDLTIDIPQTPFIPRHVHISYEENNSHDGNAFSYIKKGYGKINKYFI